MSSSTALVSIKSVAVVSTDKMKSNKELSRVLVLRKAFSGDEKIAMMKNLAMLDEAIKHANKKNLKLSDDVIDVEFDTIDGKYGLSVQLGQDNFKKDFKHLVAIGSRDLNAAKPSKETNAEYEKTLNPFSSVSVNSKNAVLNTLEGGIKAIEMLGNMSGDNDCAKAFSDNLTKTYSSLNIRVHSRDTTSFNTDMLNNFKELSSVMKVMPKSKSKQREITNHKDLGRSV
nr:hypothetical protein [uncultured Campylobacter sp.]